MKNEFGWNIWGRKGVTGEAIPGVSSGVAVVAGGGGSEGDAGHVPGFLVLPRKAGSSLCIHISFLI